MYESYSTYKADDILRLISPISLIKPTISYACQADIHCQIPSSTPTSIKKKMLFCTATTIKRAKERYNIVFKRSIIILALFASVLQKVEAQYDVSFSHYFDMEPSFNPAAVGKQSKLNVTAAYAMTMAGFEHNPNTVYAAADLPFMFIGGLHGAGIQFVNDKLGLYTHQRIALQYAYKHSMLGGTISIGANIGLITEAFKGSEVDIEDTDDPAISTSDVDGNGLDIGAGIYYTHGPWYAGVSVTHVNAPTVELGEKSLLKIDRTYYATAGYDIQLRNPMLKIKTSALGRTDGVAWRADITGRLVYTNDKKVMYAGVAYSPTNSITALIGGRFHGIMLGYSYEFYTSAISVGNGSHELFVSYQHDLNLVKKGKNKHKSVRIL